MAAKDYYTTLGVARDASGEAIRRAYRKLARQYHPDVNKNGDAQEKFKEINAAYETLKDQEKRQLYDQYGPDYQQRSAASDRRDNFSGFRTSPGRNRRYSSYRRSDFGQEETADEDLFSAVFGGRDRQHGFTGMDEFTTVDQADEAELQLSLAELAGQVEKTVSLQTVEPAAGGEYRQVNRTIKVKIPAGMTEGSVIRLAGQGTFDPLFGRQRDLLLRVAVHPDPCFTLDGHDLHTVVAVSPWEAALGAVIPVQTLGGSVKLNIPAGSQTGLKLRLRGKGLPGREGAAGDIIVELEVQVPAHLSAREERLFRELARTSTFNPREKTAQRRGRGKA
ncbi:MAG: DnaJ C-terminal domain-containing protein [Desulfopila sp.]